jgi:TRAP-type C4-dicarboxylate transport system permease small subunit
MGVNIFYRICNILRQTLLSLCKILLILQVLITAYCVFGRYVLNSSPAWGETAANMCFVWIALIGAGLAVRDDLHMKITLTEHILPAAIVKILDAIATAAILLFAAFMLIKGYSAVLFAAGNTLPGMNIKSSWLYLSIPVAGGMIVLSVMERLFRKKEAK